MALVKFSQDDSQPFGTGIFVNDKGRSIYTSDPDGARSIPPTPAPPTEAEEPAPPGTRVSFAGDTSSPYANTVASNEGATGSAAVGAPEPGATVAKAVSVVPPDAPASAAAEPAVRAPPTSAPAAAMAKLRDSGLIPTKSSTTVVQGRKAKDVENQIGTQREAFSELDKANEDSSKAEDARNVAVVDKRLGNNAGQQAQLKEDIAQRDTDVRAAESRVAQYMDLPDGKVEPDRFMGSLSTGSKIGMTVLSMLSGAFAAMQGQPGRNPFMDELNKRIDEDIKVQQDQIAQGRLRKSNLIARAEAKGATAQQAGDIARAQLIRLAADNGDLQAQRLGLQGAALDAWHKQKAVMLYQAGVHEGELRSQEESRIQSTREQENKSAGVDPSKLAEMQAKAWETYNKAVDAGQDKGVAYRESGLQSLGVTAPAGMSKDELARAKPSSEKEKRDSQLSSLTNLATQLDQLPEDTHSRSTEFIGRRMAKGAADFILGEGSGDNLPLDPARLSKQKLADRQVFEQAVNNFASLQSQALGQGALAGPEFDRAKAAAYAMGPKELAHAIRSFTTTVSGKGAADPIQVEDR